MYYKVYAQNCKTVKPIKEISENELRDVIEVLINQAIDIDLVGPDNIDAAYDKALAHLEEIELLSCGDYCIVKQDVVPTERPNMCGFDTFIFED